MILSVLGCDDLVVNFFMFLSEIQKALLLLVVSG